ncbi:glucose 1-dehydrogenase [Devosia ginsengisoli]|uniref:glucose 1-dehydrogenase n=1 Tax=Devosia ginsengisoli TaxID=400770 RepID=UPI0026F193DF|nr:glucose 1-dehydrogenase [Devosia ginsengisoli]MCR6671401.1 glucose 1-dehydrogenase [Devosia ginsengisoli]
MGGRLENGHVFVTGGSRGIGAAIVEKALAEGASVTMVDLDRAAGEAFVAGLADRDRVHFEAGDIRRIADISRVHDAGVKKFGAVTGLVNNAGRNSNADPVAMTEAEWDDVFSVDLKAAWLCAKVMLPAMLEAKAGSIVNIASVHADHTFPGYFPYAAAKSGLVGLTRSLALEVGPRQVRVNAISPGWTETKLVAEYLATQPPEMRQQVLDVHPMARIARPSEIANCVVFLLSDEASFVTGANWRVDGGLGARFAG